MKHVKRILAFALTFVMALAVALPAFADETPETASTTGTITINNAAKNETYTIYKVLDATISNKGGINYTGTIPEDLKGVLEVQTVGDSPNTYSAVGKKSGVTDEVYFAAIETYAKSTTAVDEKVADGSGKVTFEVAPGYYVVTSSQGTKVMIDSATNPASVINEKNASTVSVVKTVENESYSIGDTVKYTVETTTANFQKVGTGADAVDKPVTHYVFSDTLPAFLTGATVTSVKIGDNPITPTPQFDATTKSFEIEWATYDEDTDTWTSKYDNGTVVTIEYQATLTDVTNIGKNDVNTITVNAKVGNNDGTEEQPTELTWSDDAEIKTYAAALKKTDGNNNALAGAEFQIAGLTATKKDEGVWVVASYDPSSTATPTTLTTDANGMLYIVGIKAVDEDHPMEVTETKAPDGYNKLQGTKDLTPQLMETTQYKTESWAKYDAKGNLIDSRTTETSEYTQVTKSLADLNQAALVIQNKKGTELPSTGGIGTTIFYVVGGVMVAGAAILLLTKRRATAAE